MGITFLGTAGMLLVVVSAIGFLCLRDDKPAEEKAVDAAGLTGQFLRDPFGFRKRADLWDSFRIARHPPRVGGKRE